ncbi:MULTISPECIES: conjugative transposon protein TraM [Bacteroidales]|uniref:Conjugative transposon protein TraM n=1 Tax=Bacteroides eggerthii TaxID=28111 RepID=A0A975KDY6_9BACE|nr:Conjugative transposon protein TraM [Parabacteroides distasonis]QUT37593.1 Conjugative transposon protein TraM [Bacteroides uniformis]QUT44223.1 Conjugative transposon protein TraM [Bacteroides eggerthii]
MENRKSNMEEEHVPAGEAPEGTRPAEAGVIPSERIKPGKRLSEEEILRRRKYIVIPAFVLVFLVVLYLIFAPSGDSGETAAGGSGFNVNVPEPTTVQLEGNKTDVYERQQARREKDRRMQSLSDLAGRLLEGKKGADSIPSPDGSIRQSADTYGQIAGQLESFYETPQATTGTLEQKVEELSRRLEEAEAENRRTGSREEMMEQSYRMAARYLNPKPETTPDEVEEEKPEPVPVSRVETGTTSALEQPLTDSALVASLAAERNYGFNTAVGSSYRMGMNTIPACISESQTLEQRGRVKLRLLAPLQAGSVTVPANSLVTGTADIRGERLDILVSSIEYAGNIIPVQLATYDIDGQRGIFVPGSESRTAAKEVMGDVSQSMGGSISFAGSAGQQVAMDLTRGVLQGGTRFISQRVKAVKVKLKAGYKVLLVTKKQ